MEENKQIQLELKPEVAKGSYSNLAIISHSHSEFVIDFATMLPGLAKPEISNRILMRAPRLPQGHLQSRRLQP